jgi:ubiquinone/menaquinone biosynthesis C-methylase UbiE
LVIPEEVDMSSAAYSAPKTGAEHPVRQSFAEIKSRQQHMWASGDYAVVAAQIAPVSERLVDAADLQAGWRVLDVATGTGSAALAAARFGCSVVGVDYVPGLLERGRRRAEAEGLRAVELVEGDAERLPVEDAGFDAVLSVFGVMFAPDQEQAARELARSCRPGGTIALASWTPSGFIGEMFQVVGRHVPPPAGLRSPLAWGTQERLQQLLGGSVRSIDTVHRHFTFRYLSPQHFVEFFRIHYGPTLKAFEALEHERREALAADLLDLARRSNRNGSGALAIPAEYLEAVAVRN